MTRERSRPFLLGVAATLVAGVVLATLIVTSGVVDVAAEGGGVQDRLLAYASTRSIAHHAPKEANPLASNPAAVETGLRQYRAVCVECHGGPGTHPEEFAAGLHPPAPDLASSAVQSFSDGMLYEVIARGVGSTGMPAFRRTLSPEQIWSIVAFVRKLPALTPAQKAELISVEQHEQSGEPPARQASGTEESHAASAPGGKVHQVSISNFQFTPRSLEVHAGDVVEWKNGDFAAHTATADGRRFDTGDILAGRSARVVLKEKGRFPYSCRYHPGMTGVVVVE